MNRGTGTGLIVFGVVMGVVGAIMAFAVTVRTEGFNIVENVQNTPTGQERVEEKRDWGSP